MTAHITSGLAPQTVEQTDVNPRALCLCGCDAHPDGKCPNRWCGCRENRDPQSGAVLTRLLAAVVAFLVCLGFALALLLASHLGQHLRCERLVASNSPAASTYGCGQGHP